MIEGYGRARPVRGLDDADEALARRALAVLERNSLGDATKPSPRLYPHQWSWDSACIAIGYARVDQARAERELRSLFAGQWRNGLLPHIVFSEGGDYFPGPEFWQTERSHDAPRSPRTSGIVQPPIHATAAWEVYRHAPNPDRARAFLRDLEPRLAAWHGYLYRERTRDGDALAELWHPWESGMDNSPLWDEALRRIELDPAEVPEYRRVDVRLADPSERPSDHDYDRYAYLVGLHRELAYDAPAIRERTPFAMRAVLFNSLLVQSNRDLAEISRVVGADPEPWEDLADRTSEAIETELWDEDRAVYLDHDVVTGAAVSTASGAAYAPLHAGVPSPERAERLVAGLRDAGVEVAGGFAVTSLPPGDPRFEPTLYWRGPIWPIHNWVLRRGLARYGHDVLAERVRTAIVELARGAGFWEHYSPATGAGHGGDEFSWTAALVLDLLFASHDERRPYASVGTDTERSNG